MPLIVNSTCEYFGIEFGSRSIFCIDLPNFVERNASIAFIGMDKKISTFYNADIGSFSSESGSLDKEKARLIAGYKKLEASPLNSVKNVLGISQFLEEDHRRMVALDWLGQFLSQELNSTVIKKYKIFNKNDEEYNLEVSSKLTVSSQADLTEAEASMESAFSKFFDLFKKTILENKPTDLRVLAKLTDYGNYSLTMEFLEDATLKSSNSKSIYYRRVEKRGIFSKVLYCFSKCIGWVADKLKKFEEMTKFPCANANPVLLTINSKEINCSVGGRMVHVKGPCAILIRPLENIKGQQSQVVKSDQKRTWRDRYSTLVKSLLNALDNIFMLPMASGQAIEQTDVPLPLVTNEASTIDALEEDQKSLFSDHNKWSRSYEFLARSKVIVSENMKTMFNITSHGRTCNHEEVIKSACDKLLPGLCLKKIVYFDDSTYCITFRSSTNLCAKPCNSSDRPVAATPPHFKVSIEAKNSESNFGNDLGSFCGLNETFCDKTKGEVVSRYKEFSLCLDKYGVHYLSSTHMTMFVLANEISSYDCTGDCKGKSCARGDCQGDEIFSNNFPTSKSTCTCSHNGNRHNVRVFSKNEWRDCWIFMKKNITAFELVAAGSGRRRGDPEEVTHLISISCSKNIITLSGLEEIQKLMICWSDHCRKVQEVGESGNGEKKVEMEKELFVGIASFQVMFWNKFNNQQQQAFTCPSLNPCDLIDCIFCLKNLLHFNCMSLIEKAILAMFIGFLAASSIIAVIYLFYLLKILGQVALTIKKLFGWIKHLCFRPIRDGIKKKVKNLDRRYNKAVERERVYQSTTKPIESSSESEGEPLIVIEKKKPITQTRKARLTSYGFGSKAMNSLTLLTIMMMVQEIRSCQDFFSVGSKGDICTKDNNCTASFSQIVSFPNIGSSACLMVKDNENNGRYLLEVSIKSFALRCKMETSYYAPDPIIETNSVYRCPQMGECKGSGCVDFKKGSKNTDIDASGSFLGDAYCMDVPTQKVGGACPAALIGLTGCAFAKVEIRGTRMFEVRTCEDLVPVLVIKVVAHSLSRSSSWTQEIKITNSEFTILKDFRFKLINIHYVPVILKECLVQEKNSTYFLASCSRRSDVVKGMVGEIQCPTYQVSESCRFSRDLVTPQEADLQLKFDHNYIKVSEYIKGKKLPQFIGDQQIFQDGRDVFMRVASNGMVTIGIESSKLSYSKLKVEVKCEIYSAEIQGCFNCNKGAKFTVTGKASANGIVVSVDCNSFSTYIVLNEVVAPVDKEVRPSGSANPPRCTFSCGVLKVEVGLEERLINQLEIKTSEHIISYGDIKPLETSWFDQSGMLLNSIWAAVTGGWFMKLLLGVIMAVFSGVLVSMIVKSINKKREQEYERKRREV